MSKTVLGFDFGTKRIGVAAGQDLTGTAQGIATITNSGSYGPWPAIEQLIKEWRPNALVVGLPHTRDSGETNLTRGARAFGTKMGQRYDLPIHFIDETLTSRAAETLVSQATPQGKRMAGKRQGLRDQIAAELILCTYFNEQDRKANVA